MKRSILPPRIQRDTSGRRRSIHFFAGVVSLLFCCTFSAAGQEAAAYINADSVTVGQRFALVLSVTHPTGSQPVLPDSVTFGQLSFGDLEVLSVIGRGTRLLSGPAGTATLDSVIFEVTTFAIDTAWVVPIAIPLVANGDTVTATSLPFIIPVASLVPETAQDVLDLAPLALFPRVLWPWLIAALLAALLVWGLIYWRRRRPQVEETPRTPRTVKINPFDAALQKLKALESVDLETESNIKPFFDDLSEVLRSYLGDVLSVHALEETTRDIIRDLRKKADPPAKLIPFETPDDVRNLLELADLVKFADFYPESERALRAVESTRGTIETIERHVRSRAVPVIEGEGSHPELSGGIPNG